MVEGQTGTTSREMFWARGGSHRFRHPLAVLVLLVGLAMSGVGTAQETIETPVGSASAPATPSEPDPDTDGSVAAEAAPTSPSPVTEPPPGVGLDQLLKIPNTLDFKEERRQGGDANEWRRRFRDANDGLAKAQKKVDDVMAELDQTATSTGGQWQVAPPGAKQTENSPLSFRLREELRRSRANLETAERRFRALIVEADLASVPQDWRAPPRQ